MSEMECPVYNILYDAKLISDLIPYLFQFLYKKTDGGKKSIDTYYKYYKSSNKKESIVKSKLI